MAVAAGGGRMALMLTRRGGRRAECEQIRAAAAPETARFRARLAKATQRRDAALTRRDAGQAAAAQGAAQAAAARARLEHLRETEKTLQAALKRFSGELEAGLDEGLSSFSLYNSRLYGESL